MKKIILTGTFCILVCFAMASTAYAPKEICEVAVDNIIRIHSSSRIYEVFGSILSDALGFKGLMVRRCMFKKGTDWIDCVGSAETANGLSRCGETMKNAIVTARKGLYLREKATTGSQIIELMPSGSKIIVIASGPGDTQHGITSTWKKVVYFNKKEGTANIKTYTGWAFGGFIGPDRGEKEE